MKVGGSGLLAGCPSTRTCRTRRECIAHISASTHVVPRSHINTHGTRAGATSAEDSRSNYRKAAPKTPQMDEARLLFSAGEEGDRNARRVAISIAALPFHPTRRRSRTSTSSSKRVCTNPTAGPTRRVCSQKPGASISRVCVQHGVHAAW